MTLPLVTIGILSWNRLHYLRATLESAHLCLQYPNIEWIVSDNESEEPGIRDYIESCEWVQHKLFKKQTHAAAMNQMVDMAKGQYLIIWPEDVQFTGKGDWLADLVEILDQHRFIGSIGLDFQRKCTLIERFETSCLKNRSMALQEFKRFGLQFRRRKTVTSSRGVKVRTCGFTMPGICGSGIPSLTRTEVWRQLGPWKTTKGKGADLIDSSLGAEDDMVSRFLVEASRSRWATWSSRSRQTFSLTQLDAKPRSGKIAVMAFTFLRPKERSITGSGMLPQSLIRRRISRFHSWKGLSP